jgi:hypothetical protein
MIEHSLKSREALHFCNSALIDMPIINNIVEKPFRGQGEDAILIRTQHSGFEGITVEIVAESFRSMRLSAFVFG